MASGFQGVDLLHDLVEDGLEVLLIEAEGVGHLGEVVASGRGGLANKVERLLVDGEHVGDAEDVLPAAGLDDLVDGVGLRRRAARQS